MQEQLEEELQRRNVLMRCLLFKDNVRVTYSGTIGSGATNVTIQIKCNLSSTECAVIMQEFSRIQGIREHPNILRMYDSFFFEAPQGKYVCVGIIESSTKSVDQDIEFRQTSSYPWSETELIHVAEQLIDAFSSLQKQGIVHRNIQPRNLFFDHTRCPKVGEFGCSLIIDTEEPNSYSIHGSPIYLSPELKFLRACGYIHRAIYSPIKSDVYSLGLTLLYMHRLTFPSHLAGDLQTDDEITLKDVIDPKLNQLLKMMLVSNPSDRPDFDHLSMFLRGESPQAHYRPILPMYCLHVAQGTPVFFESSCHGQFCRNCCPAPSFLGTASGQSWYQFICPRCQTLYHVSQETQPDEERKTSEESQTDFPSIIPTESYQICEWCKVRTDRSLSHNPSEAVLKLHCGHQFCSQQCFCIFYHYISNLYQNLEVRCPTCDEIITKELAERFYGGQDVFQRVLEATANKENVSCSVCLTNIGLQKCDNQWFCTDCFKIKTPSKSNTDESEEQPRCYCWRLFNRKQKKAQEKPVSIAHLETDAGELDSAHISDRK